ncbi:hypothetical protein TSOC_011244, partial [Tetrabaena socialis]
APLQRWQRVGQRCAHTAVRQGGKPGGSPHHRGGAAHHGPGALAARALVSADAQPLTQPITQALAIAIALPLASALSQGLAFPRASLAKLHTPLRPGPL